MKIRLPELYYQKTLHSSLGFKPVMLSTSVEHSTRSNFFRYQKTSLDVLDPSKQTLGISSPTTMSTEIWPKLDHEDPNQCYTLRQIPLPPPLGTRCQAGRRRIENLTSSSHQKSRRVRNESASTNRTPKGKMRNNTAGFRAAVPPV